MSILIVTPETKHLQRQALVRVDERNDYTHAIAANNISSVKRVQTHCMVPVASLCPSLASYHVIWPRWMRLA